MNLRITWTPAQQIPQKWICDLFPLPKSQIFQIRCTLYDATFTNSKNEKVPRFTCRIKGRWTETLFNRKRFPDVHSAMRAASDAIAYRVAEMLKQFAVAPVTAYTHAIPSNDDVKVGDIRYITSDPVEARIEAAAVGNDVVKLTMIVCEVERKKEEP